jgi:hypothetical protein
VRWVRHRLHLPSHSPLRALALAEAPPGVAVEIGLPDLSALPTPLEKAHFLLDVAAEIEHALLVQYLYAAYSLKAPAEVQDAPQKAALREWKARLTGIAKEEMGHLMTVQNLLRLLGLPLYFEREHLPVPPRLYPFEMRLEPLTQQSLAKYVIAESPVKADGIDDILQLATQGAGAAPNHVGALYALLAVVFSRPEDLINNALGGDPWGVIVRDVGSLALTQEPGARRWHLPDGAFDASSLPGQATDAEWAPAAAIRVFAVSDRQGALAALRDVAVQGEGPAQPTTDPNGSHFQRFFAVYRGSATAMAFPAADGAWRPARDVPTNPRLDAISDVKAADFARLSDLRYALLLGFLQQTYLAPPGLRRMIIGWCFNEMRLLQTFSTVLTGLPRPTGQPGVAALPFSLPEPLHLPAQAAAQWQVHLDRLTAARDLTLRMLASHSQDDSVLKLLEQDDLKKAQVAEQARQGSLPIPARGRWEQVRSILGAAVGFGSTKTHGRFWNDNPLPAFITLEVEGVPVIAPPGPNRGRNSTLVKALKGEDPFDGSRFDRMPEGRPPVAAEHVAFIEKWIDDGCPEV